MRISSNSAVDPGLRVACVRPDEHHGRDPTIFARRSSAAVRALARVAFESLLKRRRSVGVAADNPEEAEELAVGVKIRAPEIAECWNDGSRYELVYSCKWKEQEPSNVIETMTAVGCIWHIGRDQEYWGCRVVIATDDLACLAALRKGRSSSFRTFGLCRQAAAYVMGYGLWVVYRFAPSLRNWADGPSRGRQLGYSHQRTGRLEMPGAKR